MKVEGENLIEERANMERVLVVGVELAGDRINIENSMDELEELVRAAGGVVEGRIVQKRSRIDSALFIGKGKVNEIKNFAEDQDISTVVFNDELSGAQLRNLEEIIDRKIVDRTNLILDIFAQRASSKVGKLQVELAQLNYRLPRLVGYRDYLSREGGGIGTRGPGEQKLETDRRHILRERTNIEKELKKLEDMRGITRKRRLDSNLPIVALIGYTNAGKSTLLNRLVTFNSDERQESGDRSVFTKDMLFATLDTALRRGQLPNGQDYLLTDTVGFVSKLPTHLVEAFKGTLEEVKYADVLLHVVDGSNEDLDIQIDTTMEILKDLDVLDKPIITVFNKMDRAEIEDMLYDSRHVGEKIFVSAKTGENIEELLEKIETSLPHKYRRVELRIPFTEQALVNYFMEAYEVDDLKHEEDGSYFKLSINPVDYERYKKYIVEELD